MFRSVALNTLNDPVIPSVDFFYFYYLSLMAGAYSKMTVLGFIELKMLKFIYLAAI